MPRGNRVLKGNKRLGVFDRMSVPQNGYRPPAPMVTTPPEQPTEPIGQKVTITYVHIYEISRSYEGKSQRWVKKIPFKDIVGSPITNESIKEGYTFTTPQNETIYLRWRSNSAYRSRQGLIVHLLRVQGTSYYEPNWGQIYGIGIEWVSCDGTQTGISWANKIWGYTYDEGRVEDGNWILHYEPYDDPLNSNPARASRAIRPELFLGDPEPKELWMMGRNLPLQVYPALGEVGRGYLFGFNANVTNFVQVSEPKPKYVRMNGLATQKRADSVSVKWAKDEFHTGTTVLGMIISDMSGIEYIRPNNLSPNSRGVYILSNPTTSRSGSVSQPDYFRWRLDMDIDTEIIVMILECDSAGNPAYVLDATIHEVSFVSNRHLGTATEAKYDGSLPYPWKKTATCVGEGDSELDPIIPSIEGDIKYFCNNSIPADSITNDYWVGDKALAPDVAAAIEAQFGVTIPPDFWAGRNGWLSIFAQSDPSIPYTNSTIQVADFHKYLFKALSDMGNGGIPDFLDIRSFKEFSQWCNGNGLVCLSELQKASLFMTMHMGVIVNFFPSAAGYLQSDILDVLLDYLLLLPKGIYDWIDFNDVAIDSEGSLTGAFAADWSDVMFKALKSFVNFEPQALEYSIGAAKAHRPMDYIKLDGIMWGTATDVNYTQYWLSEMNNLNYVPYVAAEVGIHEIGHCVAYYGLDKYGQVLHVRPDWLSISGWGADSVNQDPNDISKHLTKSLPADETGGMPITDAGYEAPVSDYGCMHPAEDFADAYRMYLLNPQFLEKFHPKKFQFMIDVVEPMFY